MLTNDERDKLTTVVPEFGTTLCMTKDEKTKLTNTVCLNMLVQILGHSPEVAATFPPNLRKIVETVEFIKLLVSRKRASTGTAPTAEWKTKLMQGLFKAEIFDEDEGSEFDIRLFRKIIKAVLAARCGLLEALEQLLNAVDVYPSHVHDLGHGNLEEMPEMIRSDPEFLWWLLNPSAVDDFTYEDKEVLLLQQHALDCHNETTNEPSYKLISALGLRGPHDLKVVAKHRAAGKSFGKAKEIAKNLRYPERPPWGRTLQRADLAAATWSI
tara:strand:+ start:4101 stop:4907 length:807 start_codon:yes stop_codon:yes gene_type:complete